MSFLKKDIRPALAEMELAVDQFQLDHDLMRCRSELLALAEEITTLRDKNRFVAQVLSLLLIGNATRAKKLVRYFGTHDLSKAGLWAARLLRLGLVTGFVSAVVVLVLWLR